jgi:hypothetical protein
MWTPIIERCVGRCGSKSGEQKGNICLNLIGLHAQNIVSNIIGGLYDHLMSMRTFTLGNN